MRTNVVLTHFPKMVSQKVSYLLYFALEIISVHLQTAAFSRTANSTSFTDIVCWIKKILHMDVSMPGEKNGRRKPYVFLVVLQRIQLRESSSKNPAQRKVNPAPNLLLGHWIQGVSCRKAWFAFADAKVPRENWRNTPEKAHANVPLLYVLEWY